MMAGRWSLQRKHREVLDLPSFLELLQIHTIIHEIARSHLVVQLPRWVTVLCRPLQAYASFLFRLFCDCLDDLAPVAFASQLMINIQIYTPSLS